MSFTWLESIGAGDLVPDGSVGPDYLGMLDSLKTSMGWSAAAGVTGPNAAKGIADFINKRGLAGKFTITYYTEAPKKAGFEEYDALQKEKSLSGSDFDMKRGGIKGEDILKEMKAGEDVLLATNTHVVDLAGMNEKKNANGNFDASIADPATGSTTAVEITGDGKIKKGTETLDIKEVIAVSPVKKK
jgi:hypothetical protein